MEGMLDSLACRLCRPLFGGSERPKCNHASRKFPIEIGLPSFAAKAEKKGPRLPAGQEPYNPREPFRLLSRTIVYFA